MKSADGIFLALWFKLGGVKGLAVSMASIPSGPSKPLDKCSALSPNSQIPSTVAMVVEGAAT